jgi:hypothetical protein
VARRPSRRAALGRPQEPGFSSYNPLAAFLAHLAQETAISERTARLYVGHLQRFDRSLADHYGAGLLEATGADTAWDQPRHGSRSR